MQTTFIRQFLLSLSLLCSFTATAASRSNFDSPIKDQPSTVFDDLLFDVNARYAQRADSFRVACQSSAQLAHYVVSVKLRLASAAGINLSDFPRCHTAQVVAQSRHALFSVCNIVLNTTISANLYYPNKPTTSATPSVLFIPGHEKYGKSTNDYQLFAQLLASNGIMCLILDPIGQGERVQLQSNNTPQFRRATEEHSVLLASSLLVGNNIMKQQLQDNRICLDFLANINKLIPSLPFQADANRIGVIGNSGGGAQASYLATFDKRIAALCVCSWVTSRQLMMQTYGPDDGCQFIPNEINKRIEIADLLVSQAPKPLLILAGKSDFILYKGTQQAYSDLKLAYKTAGNANAVSLFANDEGHGISRSKRAEALKFFRKSFSMSTDTLLTEQSLRLRPIIDSLLRTNKEVTSSTQGNLPLQNLKAFEDATSSRASLAVKSPNVRQMVIAGLLNIPHYNPPIANPRLQNLNISHFSLLPTNNMNAPARVSKHGGRLITYELIPDSTIPIIDYMVLPVIYRITPDSIIRDDEDHPELDPLAIQRDDLGTRNEILLLSDSGFTSSTAKRFIDATVKAGASVYLCDLSGTGSLRDDPKAQDPKFHDSQYRIASLALMAGRSLVSLQTEQLMAVLQALPKNINIVSIGSVNIPAMHAIYLSGRTPSESLIEINPATDWEELITYPATTNTLHTIVPNALQFYTIQSLRTGFKRKASTQSAGQSSPQQSSSSSMAPRPSVRTEVRDGVTIKTYTIY